LSYSVNKFKFINAVKPKLDIYNSFSDRPNLSKDGRAQLAGFANDLEYQIQSQVYQTFTALIS